MTESFSASTPQTDASSDSAGYPAEGSARSALMRSGPEAEATPPLDANGNPIYQSYLTLDHRAQIEGAPNSGFLDFRAPNIANLTGYTITVSNLAAYDRLSIANQGNGAGQIGVSGGHVSFGGVEIGTLTGGNGTTLTVALNGAATSAAVEAVAHALQYQLAAGAGDVSDHQIHFDLRTPNGDSFNQRSPWESLPGQALPVNPFAGIDLGPNNRIAMGDVNGDGYTDLIGAGNVSYTWRPVEEQTEDGSNPLYMQIDGVWMTADAILDASPSVLLYLGGADGQFTLTPAVIPMQLGGNRSVSLADSDGDGDLDIFYVDGAHGFEDNYVNIIRNDGNLHFTDLGPVTPTYTSYFEAYASTLNVAAGDIMGDGHVVALMATYYGTGGYTGSGTTWSPLGHAAYGQEGEERLALVDYDGDGDLDMFMWTPLDGSRGLTNTGTMPFQPIYNGSSPFAFIGQNVDYAAFADVDRDGRQDMVISRGSQLTVLWNTANTGYVTDFDPGAAIHIDYDFPAASQTAPTGVDNVLTIAEDSAHALQPSDFGFADGDGDSPLELIVTTVPANGTLSLDGGPVHAGDVIPWANIVDGWLVYAPAADAHGEGYAGFTFQVRDDGGSDDTDATPNTITFDVTPVNDAPDFAPAPLPPVALTHSANVTNTSSSQSVSADGNLIVFASSTQLVPGDTDARSDIYLLDRSTGEFTRITSAEGPGYSMDPVISADGSKIAFFSAMNNLVPGDTNNTLDVFVYDVASGTITRASEGSNGEQGGGFSMYDRVAISSDGTRVAFTSMLSGLVPGDNNGRADVFVKNLLTGELTRASVTSEGGQLLHGAFAPFFSADGTKLGFTAEDPATADDTNGTTDIYVRDLTTGEVTRVSADFEGGDAAFRDPVFSPDGTKIMFSSYADGLVEGDFNDAFDIFLLDLVTGEITLVSGSASGAIANDSSGAGRFSPDGTKIVFSSSATNLIDGETGPDNVQGLFLKDLATGEVTRLSVNPDGSPSSAWLVPTAFLGNGELLIGSQNPLTPGDADDFTSDFYVLTLHEAPTRYIDSGAPVTLAPNVILNDVDGSSADGASLVIAIDGDADTNDQLMIVESQTPGTGLELVGPDLMFDGVVIGTYHIANDEMSFSFGENATTDMVKAIAQAIQFENSSTVPAEGIRTVTFTYDDGGVGGEVSFARQVDVIENNNAPVSDDQSVTFDEDAGYTFGLADFGFDSVDSEGDALTHILIETPPLVGFMLVVGNGAPTFVVPGTAVSVADIAAGKLVYFTLPDAHGSFDFTYRGVDNGGTADGGHDTSELYTFTLDVTPVNDDPVLSLGAFGTGDIALDLTEGGFVQIAPEGTLFDADLGDFDGGTVTISVTDGTDDDVFRLAGGTVEADDDGIWVEGVLVGTWLGTPGTTIQLALTADATAANLQTLLRAVEYGTTSDAPPETREIVVSVTDGDGGTSETRTATVTIAAVDDPTSPQSDYVDVMENGTVVFDVLANEYDPDGGPAATLASVAGQTGNLFLLSSGARITLNPDGTLTYLPRDYFNWLPSDAKGAQTGAISSTIESFTYTLSNGLSATVYVTVHGVDSPEDRLYGTSANDTMTGTAGADYFDGLGGDDRMSGGAGDDVYIVSGLGDVVIERAYEGDDTVRSSVSFTLVGYIENLFLTGVTAINGTGNSLANNLSGNNKANVLSGGDGNDVIDGRVGADTMIGGAGDDIFYVNQVGDLAVEAGGQGYDTVYSEVSYALTGQYIEKLILIGDSAINGTGNSLANVLIGNEANNTLNGADGNDELDGGLGVDTMIGGLGDDVFHVDQAGDLAVEAANSGTDTVLSSISYSLAGQYIENLTLTGAAAINGTGNKLDNVITGNGAANTLNGGEGNDTIDGGAGADTLIGGLGYDTYYVDNAGDVVIERNGEGLDTIHSTVSYSLAGQYVENLLLEGSANINGTGNKLANFVIGNDGVNVMSGGDGDDFVDGGLGADTLIGGTGDDKLFVDNIGDVVIERGGEGHDTVYSSVNFSLAGQYIEDLILTGEDAINGTGNSLANVIWGNDAANVLSGGDGDDMLHGGLGADTLTGGNGADGFWLDPFSKEDAVDVDTITDFNVAADTIYMDPSYFNDVEGTLSADAFVNGTVAQDADDRILYDAATGRIFYDEDGAGGVDAVLFARVTPGTLLTHEDFVGSYDDGGVGMPRAASFGAFMVPASSLSSVVDGLSSGRVADFPVADTGIARPGMAPELDPMAAPHVGHGFASPLSLAVDMTFLL